MHAYVFNVQTPPNVNTNVDEDSTSSGKNREQSQVSQVNANAGNDIVLIMPTLPLHADAEPTAIESPIPDLLTAGLLGPAPAPSIHSTPARVDVTMNQTIIEISSSPSPPPSNQLIAHLSSSPAAQPAPIDDDGRNETSVQHHSTHEVTDAVLEPSILVASDAALTSPLCSQDDHKLIEEEEQVQNQLALLPTPMRKCGAWYPGMDLSTNCKYLQ